MLLRPALAVVFLLLAFFPAFQSVSGPHIADLNVLLPPLMTSPVQYRLQGSDGCFTWSWDHHDILDVQPEYNGSSRCSTSARLISVASYGGRKETAVFASDIRTGTVIRCEVFIDKISKIKILHHALKLDLDGLATLRVHAFDDEENVFSSLVGLQFMWHLMPESSEAGNHLVHVPLRDTPLSDGDDIDTQIKLEDSGVGSDLYVVRGIKIGHEIVSVHFLEPQLKHVRDEIVLTVAEAMSLDPPSPVFVIVGASVQYSLRVLRQNTSQAVLLPSPYHRWSVMNSSVASIDSMMGLATALKLGVTDINVEDTRVAGHRQISSLHVVQPDRLILYILPATISCDPLKEIEATPSTVLWYLVVGETYVIDLRVFSRESIAQPIYITENDDLKLHYNHSAYWETFSVTGDIAAKHGWQKFGCIRATSQGLGRLAASLSYSSGDSVETKVLNVVEEVMVCNRVKINMRERYDYSQPIRLPWTPGVFQEVVLTATGGCGKTAMDYKWTSSDVETVFISVAGLLQAKKPGTAIVKVVSIFDSINYHEVLIEVSIPSSIVMLQGFPVEAVVGTYLQAAVTMKTSNGNYFYKCDAFSSFLRWQVFSGSGTEPFKIVNTTGEAHTLDLVQHAEAAKSFYSPPCAWVHLYASIAGRATLHATMSIELQSSVSRSASDGPVILKASSLIAAYPPLTAQQAGHGNHFGGYWVDLAGANAGSDDIVRESLDELFLVPGTGMHVILLGGPEHWGQDVDFIEAVDIVALESKPTEDAVLVEKAFSGGGRLYRIFCQSLGSFKLTFSRGNSVGDDHPLPVLENVELSLVCSFPSSITLIANEPVNKLNFVKSAAQADRGPGKIRASPITVANGCTIRIAAIGIHKSGEAFANSSSLCLKWELSSCEGLAYWDDTDRSLQRSGATWERFLVLQNASGLCMVRATVVGFSDTMRGLVFEKASLLLENSENVLTDAIRLQLVSSLRVFPETALLFFHPDARVILSIFGGSCYLDPVVNDTQVIELIQQSPSMQCMNLMLGARGLGTAVVTVRDIGLAAPLGASALVRVANVDWIKILSEEEISLLVGSTKSMDILAGIRDGSVFDSSQDGVLALINEDGLSRSSVGKISSPSFSVHAENFGATTLHVSARQASGREILSQLIKVEVYMPLRIHPDDIFLAPGASYVLTVNGGPTTGVVVDYASMDDSTATVQRHSGRLSAISPGNTSIHAAVYGPGGNLICEAYGRVKVGIPSSMILNLQSELLGVGHEIPVHPVSPEGSLFSFYDLCKNYQWTVEDDQVLSFITARSSHNDKHGHIFSGEDTNDFFDYPDSADLGFINVLYGRSAGRTNVAVSFSCDFVSSGNSCSVLYNATESVWVIPELPLSLGAPATWVLPPFYKSLNLLPASSETHQWDSRYRKGNIVYSLKVFGEKKDGLLQDAIVIDGGSIQTMESGNIGCILAKDRSTGRTDIACCVRVAEVAQVRVTTKEFPFHVADLVVGAKLKLVVNFRDVIGIPFHEAHNVVQVDVDTNYPDIVSIQTSSDESDMLANNGNIHLQLTAIHHGSALVRVSFKDRPRKADYILVSAGASIGPRNPVVHVGSHLTFSINGEGMDDLKLSKWMSANESILSIDSISGKAHANDYGKTQVLFESPNLKLRTTVTVLRAALIVVDAPVETLTNAPFPANGYNFSVRVSDSNGRKFEVVGNSMDVLHDCSVDPPFIGYSKPWRDLDTGNSYCLFFPYSPHHLARTTPKLKATWPELKSNDRYGCVNVSVIASLRDAQLVTGTAHVLFCGGFSILEMPKLNLTPNSNKSLVTVVGNTDVDIHWHARDLMTVVRVSSDGNSGIGGQAEYEVEILRDQSFTDRIIITLPATGQRAELDVSYEHGGSTPAPLAIGTIVIGILGCVGVLLLTMVLYLWFLDRPDRPRETRPPATLALTDAATPQRSPAGNAQWSPRTPSQPFTEYVRRTLDETPYLRREGRRRLDPQYTY